MSLDVRASKPEGQSPKVKKRSKKRSTLPDSLFQTITTKTVDTRVSSMKPETDELQLVEMGAERATSSSSCSVRGQTEAEVNYKAHHQVTLPREW